MYKGELKHHSEAYRCGHETGSLRAYDDAICWFEELMRHEDYMVQHSTWEVVMMLKRCKLLWIEHCETFGMDDSDPFKDDDDDDDDELVRP